MASLEGLKGAEDVAAVTAQPPHRYGLAELVGDRTFEELRRAKRDKRRRGATEGDRRLPAARVRAASGRCEELRTSVSRGEKAPEPTEPPRGRH